MIRKVFAFFILVCHVNLSMFLPQMSEIDVFDSAGQQVDDINSVSEYINQVILGNGDEMPEDEDDDDGQYFLIVTTHDIFCQVDYKLPAIQFPEPAIKFPCFSQPKVLRMSFDIQSPPPEV